MSTVWRNSPAFFPVSPYPRVVLHSGNPGDANFGWPWAPRAWMPRKVLDESIPKRTGNGQGGADY